MNESNYILFFWGALGAFNGLVLAVYLLFFSRKKNLPNLFLGFLLLMLSIHIGRSVLLYFDPSLPDIYLQTGLAACFLIGPCLFFFVRSTIQQPATIPAAWKWHIGALVGGVIVAGVLFHDSVGATLCNKYVARGVYAAWSIYVAAAAVQMKDVFIKLFRDRKSLKAVDKWLLTIFFANTVIFLAFLGALPVGRLFNICFSGALIFSFVFYSIIFVLLYKKNTAELFAPAPVKYQHKKVDDDEAAVLLQKLEQEIISKAIFKNTELTVGELAKAINLSSHQLSQLLNDNQGQNFTSYINEYRINEACKMIAANHPFSLEAIGYEVGFNSKSTFYAAFKKITGTTPSVYKESLVKASVS
ncbi:MAG: helix-turn-helix domain-containing protein [Chitinophagaceae bacterium]